MITESKICKQITEFMGHGQFLDQQDLEKVYKDKPDQLKNVKENAPQLGKIDALHQLQSSAYWESRTWHKSDGDLCGNFCL